MKYKTQRRKTLLQVLFGRTGIVVLLLLLQIAALVSIVFFFGDYIPWIYAFSAILSGFVVVYIFNRSDNPAFKMTWIIPILVIPVFGVMMYLFVRLQFGTRLLYKKHAAIIKDTKPYLPQNADVLVQLERLDAQAAATAKYVSAYGGYPVWLNGQAEYFPVGENLLDTLYEQLESAERFIFLEYFIIERGYVWNKILDILTKKAAQGVDVKLFYDGTCSIALLPYDYPKRMAELGIQCRMFNRIKPFLSTIQNNRDHRKIIVIDGECAFTGGINLADEYFNRREVYGHWKDTAVMIKGPAVKSFTVMFLQMWYIEQTPPHDFKRYFKEDIKLEEKLPSDGFIIPYGDSPLDNETVGKAVYYDIINTAKSYVHIMTPYLIPDNELLYSLTRAAKCGKDIRIIMPGIPDKKPVYYLGRTYYKELIQAGVRIYEYTPGFIHAKSFVSDDIKAVVGSINLDYRSLYLHFECGCYMYASECVADIERDFTETAAKCRQVTLEDCDAFPLFQRIAGKILRLFAPLL